MLKIDIILTSSLTLYFSIFERSLIKCSKTENLNLKIKHKKSQVFNNKVKLIFFRSPSTFHNKVSSALYVAESTGIESEVQVFAHFTQGRIKVIVGFRQFITSKPKNKALIYFHYFVFCRTPFPHFEFMFYLCKPLLLINNLHRPLFSHRPKALCPVCLKINPAGPDFTMIENKHYYLKVFQKSLIS